MAISVFDISNWDDKSDKQLDPSRQTALRTIYDTIG